jgi:1,4-dihydroxy-2-naphthoate octaprenyltransferase
MGWLFIAVLLILAVHYWYVTAGLVALWLFVCLVLAPLWSRAVKDADEQMRHRQARAEIDAVIAATTWAMVDAARETGS